MVAIQHTHTYLHAHTWVKSPPSSLLTGKKGGKKQKQALTECESILNRSLKLLTSTLIDYKNA